MATYKITIEFDNEEDDGREPVQIIMPGTWEGPPHEAPFSWCLGSTICFAVSALLVTGHTDLNGSLAKSLDDFGGAVNAFVCNALRECIDEGGEAQEILHKLGESR